MASNKVNKLYIVTCYKIKFFNILYRYTWKRNGEDFKLNVQDDRIIQLPNAGTLVFNITEDKDEGFFQCFADNGYGISVSNEIYFIEAKLTNFSYEPKRVVYLLIK